MHTYTFSNCLDTGMQNGDKASPSISPAGRGQLVKMLITAESMVYFDQILLTYTFLHCLAIGMQNGDEALPSISPAGHGQLVKVFITLEPHGIF